MAATTKANVLIIAPELSTVGDDTWNLILADVDRDVSSAVFGNQRERAARYLAAHYLTLSTQGASGGASGPIIKEKVGDVMREYSGGMTSYGVYSPYARTPYGLTFLEIRNKVLGAFRVVTPG
jgi:hypothetical protein